MSLLVTRHAQWTTPARQTAVAFLDDASARQRQENVEADQAALRERLAYRRTPRLTLDAVFPSVEYARASYTRTGNGLYEEDSQAVQAVGGGASIGYRQNVLSYAGIWARAGLGFAGVSGDTINQAALNTSASTTSRIHLTTMTEVSVDVMPYVGPFGRFYLGAILWGAYASLPQDHSTDPSTGEVLTTDFKESTLWRGGAGLGFGFFVLRREQLIFDARLKFDQNGQPTFQLSVGCNLLLAEQGSAPP